MSVQNPNIHDYACFSPFAGNVGAMQSANNDPISDTWRIFAHYTL